MFQGGDFFSGPGELIFCRPKAARDRKVLDVGQSFGQLPMEWIRPNLLLTTWSLLLTLKQWVHDPVILGNNPIF